MVIATAGLAVAAAAPIVGADGSGRVAVSIVAVLLLLLGGAAALAIPLRLATSVAQLPAVRARVTDVSFDAASLDTIEAAAQGMARGNAVLEPHPDCTYRPRPEERPFEVDEGWAVEIAPRSILVGLLHPRRRSIHALGVDADVTSVDDG